MNAIDPISRLAVLRQVLEDYEAWRRVANNVAGLPALALVGLKVAPRADSSASLMQANKFAGNSGWVRLQSDVAVVGEDGTLSMVTGPWSPIAGEWRESETRSIHLRPDGVGGSRVWRYEERALAPADTLTSEEFPALREVTTVLPAEREGKVATGKLVYHVYWCADSDDAHALRRLCYRFVRFEKADSQGR